MARAWLNHLREQRLATAAVGALILFYVAVAITATECYVVFECALSPDGRFFIHDSTRGRALFDSQDGRKMLALDRGHCIFSPSSQRLAVHFGSSVQFWDLVEFRYLFALNFGEGRVWRVAFLDDETIAAVKSDRVEWWNVRSRERTRTAKVSFGIPEGSAPDVALSRNGRRLAVGNDWLGHGTPARRHYRLDIWDLEEPPQRRESTGEQAGTIGHLVLSDDGHLLAADVGNDRDANGSLRVWGLDANAPAESRPVGAVHGISFSPDSTKLAFVDWRYPASRIMIWEMGSKQFRQVALKTRPSDGRIDALTFAPDGRGIVIGDSNGVVERWTTNPPALASRVAGLLSPPPVPRWVWGALAAFLCVWLVAWIARPADEPAPARSGPTEEWRVRFLLVAFWGVVNGFALLAGAYAEAQGALRSQPRALGIAILVSLAVLAIVTVAHVRSRGAGATANLALSIALGVVCFDIGLVLRLAQDSA